MDIAGNEKADEEAKKAARGQLAGEPLLQHKLKSLQVTKINHDINAATVMAPSAGSIFIGLGLGL